jgi:hypothetical protein
LGFTNATRYLAGEIDDTLTIGLGLYLSPVGEEAWSNSASRQLLLIRLRTSQCTVQEADQEDANLQYKPLDE